jgi:hypothetical protein
MVTKCLGRVLREMHLGKTILVWGDPASIENLRHRLESSGIVTYGFMPSPGPKTALRS